MNIFDFLLLFTWFVYFLYSENASSVFRSSVRHSVRVAADCKIARSWIAKPCKIYSENWTNSRFDQTLLAKYFELKEGNHKTFLEMNI